MCVTVILNSKVLKLKSGNVKSCLGNRPLARRNGAKSNIVTVSRNEGYGSNVLTGVGNIVNRVLRNKFCRTVLYAYTVLVSIVGEGNVGAPGNAGDVNALGVDLPLESGSVIKTCYGVAVLIFRLNLCGNDGSNIGTCVGSLVTAESEVKLINIVTCEGNRYFLTAVNGDDAVFGIVLVDGTTPLECREVNDLLAGILCGSTLLCRRGNRSNKTNRHHYNEQ